MNAYNVGVDDEGCKNCGEGRTYVVVRPDGIALGQSWDDVIPAQELADELNAAFELGRESVA